MAIAESQLEVWSHQGATATSAATYDAIRRVLLDPRAPFANRQFEVFLQGSYANDTNVFADSDVDVVACLTSTYYEDTSSLQPGDMTFHDADWTPASYSWDAFKAEVADWLALNFGGGVDPSGKAILVPGDGRRRDADVLACAEFRHYHSYAARFSQDFWSGICFWHAGGRIVNYPKQHSANCTRKHQSERGWFKPTVRILKNMRNAMVRDGWLAEGVAPSYFLEGMLSNVPDNLFGLTYRGTVAAAIAWLAQADPSELLCANGIHYLVREGHSVCWSPPSFRAYLAATAHYWDAH